MSTGMGENVRVLVVALTGAFCFVGGYAIVMACADRWFARRGRRRD